MPHLLVSLAGKKSDLGFLKANSDANLKNIDSWGLGGIIRNDEGFSYDYINLEVSR